MFRKNPRRMQTKLVDGLALHICSFAGYSCWNSFVDLREILKAFKSFILWVYFRWKMKMMAMVMLTCAQLNQVNQFSCASFYLLSILNRNWNKQSTNSIISKNSVFVHVQICYNNLFMLLTAVWMDAPKIDFVRWLDMRVWVSMVLVSVSCVFIFDKTKFSRDNLKTTL